MTDILITDTLDAISDVFTELGKTAYIRRITLGAYIDESAPSKGRIKTTIDYKASVIVSDYSADLVDGEIIQRGDKQVFVSLDSVGIFGDWQASDKYSITNTSNNTPMSTFVVGASLVFIHCLSSGFIADQVVELSGFPTVGNNVRYRISAVTDSDFRLEKGHAVTETSPIPAGAKSQVVGITPTVEDFYVDDDSSIWKIVNVENYELKGYLVGMLLQIRK
jgi:hypothetical protein